MKYLKIILPLLLLLAMLISVGIGATPISVLQIISIILNKISLPAITHFDVGQENVFWIIRLPRVILGVLVGAALAISGAAMQGLFRNPLADPGLIGVSSGASFFAVLSIVVFGNLLTQFEFITNELSYYLLNITTFIGAFLAAILVFYLARSNGKTVVSTMLLAGIAINALCGAFIGFITYYATDVQIRNITFWSLGSLGGASWQTVIAILPFVLIPIVYLPTLGKALNAYALGESEANYLGINIAATKIKIIVMSALAIGASVAVCGIIGFVGLVVPHVLRLIFGPDNKQILPASAFTGAILLTLSDLLARTIVAPSELPIGIITALIGAPFFLYILMQKKKTLSL